MQKYINTYKVIKTYLLSFQVQHVVAQRGWGFFKSYSASYDKVHQSINFLLSITKIKSYVTQFYEKQSAAA